jgi:hypothetical protein
MMGRSARWPKSTKGGEPNTGGEVRAWGFDLSVTSGRTDCAGAAANGVAPAALAGCRAAA